MPNKPLYHSILLIKAFLTSQGEKGEPGLVPVVSIHMSVLFPCAFSKVSYSVVAYSCLYASSQRREISYFIGKILV